jgi:hypothetical protein
MTPDKQAATAERKARALRAQGTPFAIVYEPKARPRPSRAPAASSRPKSSRFTQSPSI